MPPYGGPQTNGRPGQPIEAINARRYHRQGWGSSAANDEPPYIVGGGSTLGGLGGSCGTAVVGSNVGGTVCTGGELTGGLDVRGLACCGCGHTLGGSRSAGTAGAGRGGGATGRRYGGVDGAGGVGEMTTTSPAIRSARFNASGRPAANTTQKIAALLAAVTLSNPAPEIPQRILRWGP